MVLGNTVMSQAIGNVVDKVSNVGTSTVDAFKDAMLTYNAEYGKSPGKLDSKYDVANLTYPLDLFGNQRDYGHNYAIFYINVVEDSKLLKSKDQAGEETQTVDIAADERLRASINQSGVTATTAVTGATVMGAIAGGVLPTDLAGAWKTAKGAGAGVVGSGLISGIAAGKMSRQQKRLKSAIALNVPNTLSVRYSANYEESGTLAFQAASQLSEGSINAITEAVKGGTVNAGAALGKTAGVGASVLATVVLNTPLVGDALSAASGLTPNPKKEQIFKGVDFRSFVFDYQFSPRSEAELKNVMNIINTFKYHMHPEFKDTASFIFVYPSEFDIHYYHREGENEFIHKHTSCVLKDLTVNYTPNTSFTTFENGAPTQINLQMTFLELAILTKDQIKMGY